MAVLEHEPGAGEEACLHLVPRDNLLAFSHTHLVRRELLLLLRQIINSRRRVRPRRQQIQHRLPSQRLLEDALNRISHRLRELRPHLRLHEHRRGDPGAVLPEGPHKHKPQERPDAALHEHTLLVVGDVNVLRLVLVEEFAPGGLVSRDEVGQFAEKVQTFRAEMAARQLNHVQPDLVRHPPVAIRPLRLQVQRRPRLQKRAHIPGGELAGHRHNAHGHHQLEHELIPLKDPPVHVPVHLVGQLIDDLIHPLAGGLDLLRPLHRHVELMKELVQGAVVHPTRRLRCDGVADHGHVGHAKIHN
mmetsp:Transcript_36118/g.82556  ORF Transcript_36118/g.82556 Transcript_36118/m.82556 type:complete len:302 (+) Transcript_36118:301-1206(+)